MKNRHYWTEHEIEILKELYPNNKTEDISKILDIDIDKIISKSTTLKLKKDFFWTFNQIEILIELYPNNTNESISKILNLPTKKIASKAANLKLKKSKEYISKNIGKRNKMVGRDLTYELLKDIASKYKTRGEFQRLDKSAYSTAQTQKILDDICSHMIKGNYSIPQLILFYIIKKLFNTEIIYNTKKIIKPYELDIFITEYNLAFEYDGKLWHIDKEKDELKNNLCLENKITLIRFTENSRDYIKDIKEQMIENITTINILTKLNIKKEDILEIRNDEIYEFVNVNINDNDDIVKIISKYKNFHDFRLHEYLLYKKLIRRGVLEKYTSGLERNRKKWNIDMIINEINKYVNLLDFIENSKGCYLYCKRNNFEYLFSELKRKRRN